MKLIEHKLDAPLSKAIQLEYNKFIRALAKLSPTVYSLKKIEGTGGKVSAVDLVAYQIGWGNALIRWYEAGIKGEKPEMPGEGFSSWDYTAIAKHFYGKYKNGQSEEFYQIVQSILAITEMEYPSGNLDKLGVWAWCTLPSGKKWPLSKWIKVNTASPYKRASTLVNKFMI